MPAAKPIEVRLPVASEQRGGFADVLVIFGITGDLAHKMTFRALYRLERRRLLTCPIIGIAVEDLSVERLMKRAPRRSPKPRKTSMMHCSTGSRGAFPTSLVTSPRTRCTNGWPAGSGVINGRSTTSRCRQRCLARSWSTSARPTW